MSVPRSFAFLMQHLRLPIAWVLYSARFLPPAISGKLMHNVAKTRLRTLFHTVDMMRSWQPKSTQIAEGVPVIILLGELDRMARGERALAAAPKAQLRILKGAGHFPLWQQREKFVQVLSNILATYA